MQVTVILHTKLQVKPIPSPLILNISTLQHEACMRAHAVQVGFQIHERDDTRVFHDTLQTDLSDDDIDIRERERERIQSLQSEIVSQILRNIDPSTHVSEYSTVQ